jgi:tryptophan synthase alpha chain
VNLRPGNLLVPYVTGGMNGNWTDYVRAYADAGADAIEVGLPFSDPVIDGPVVQEASDRALARGSTVAGLLAELSGLDVGVPLIAMTYANLARPAAVPALRDAGLAGLIVPDLPLEESGPLERAAAAAGVDLVLLAAPATPPARRIEIATRSRGFVYATTLMGTTGVRPELAATGAALAADLKRYTDRPVLLGIGISTPDQAAEACRYADGVIVGSLLVRAVLDGRTPAEVGALVSAMRRRLSAERS